MNRICAVLAFAGWVIGTVLVVAQGQAPLHDEQYPQAEGLLRRALNQAAREDSGLTTVIGWATNIKPGPSDESFQSVSAIM